MSYAYNSINVAYLIHCVSVAKTQLSLINQLYSNVASGRSKVKAFLGRMQNKVSQSFPETIVIPYSPEIKD
jgi:hypothetical protein